MMETMTHDRSLVSDLIARVISTDLRDEDLESEIAATLQYLPDPPPDSSNIRRHPTLKFMLLYDTPRRTDIPTWSPMLTTSLDAVEKLRAKVTPSWTLDVVRRQEDEFLARASSIYGKKVQATAKNEVRVRLAIVLEALKKPHGDQSETP